MTMSSQKENGRGGRGILFVISSPSGGGKTTLVHRLLEEVPDLSLSVSHTTREPRPEESDGRDYHFVSEDEFTRLREQDGFIEWARVHANYYGTSRGSLAAIGAEGKDALLDIDVQGGQQVREALGQAVLIFILPPEREEWVRRLKERGTESPAQLQERLKAAEDELALIPIYDYAVRNDNLEDALDALRSIVIAERCRVSRSS